VPLSIHPYIYMPKVILIFSSFYDYSKQETLEVTLGKVVPEDVPKNLSVLDARPVTQLTIGIDPS